MNRRYHHAVAGIALTVCMLLGVTACGKPDEKAVGPMTYRLKWIFNISVIGDLYARDQGLFRAQGLEVAVKPGGSGHDALKELELGQAQFGVASADQVIRAAAKGSPVVVIAQLFQANPLQWIYRSQGGRSQGGADRATPDALKGKRVGITYGGNDENIMKALLNKHNIREDQLQLHSVRFDFTPFYQRKVDFWPVYRNTQGVLIGRQLQNAGEPFGFFNPGAHGIRFVANSVVTTRDMVTRHPETVKRFLTALLQGWQQALDPANETTALAVARKFDQDTPADLLPAQLATTRDLILAPAGSKYLVGAIDVEAWKQTETIMLTQKLIDKPVKIENHLIPLPQSLK